MSCAKRQVTCVIVTPWGKAYFGSNDCLNPQDSCPRLLGENYDKCKSICQQTNHAEINALKSAGADAMGSTAYLVGHYHFCQACQNALFAAGIKYLATATNHD